MWLAALVGLQVVEVRVKLSMCVWERLKKEVENGGCGCVLFGGVASQPVSLRPIALHHSELASRFHH